MFATFQPVEPRTGTTSNRFVVVNLEHVTKVRIEIAAQDQGITYAQLVISSGQDVENVYVAAAGGTEAMKEQRITEFLDLFGTGPRAVFSSTKDSSDPR
jgi:hypothetical protein